MGGKIQKILINVLLTLAVMCSVMCFLILLEKYEINHKKSRATDYELKASEYKALTAQYQMQNAKLRLDVEEAKLKVFIETYGSKK